MEETEPMKAHLRSGAKKSNVHFRDPVSSPNSAGDLLNHPPSSSSESGHVSSKDSLSDKNRPDPSLLSLLIEKEK
ncbi:hypothetical protein L1987_37278 [Smallanthus sonchifolius]|uniref:Uncharacterized protein n=1 Tax=Smallanthus sonchifolius TaxID=185202 RepID=A0ACB9HHP8_9ASTR|nr:hypothetical protein L1987_37278 [Smallanthus sonchifolius]